MLTYSLNSVLHRSTSGDTVQLVEQSLDTNLLNNAIKIKFSHCTVLPGGIHVQENLNNVIILICTNQSVHRLLLAHPTRMYRSVSGRHLMQNELDVVKEMISVFGEKLLFCVPAEMVSKRCAFISRSW